VQSIDDQQSTLVHILHDVEHDPSSGNGHEAWHTNIEHEKVDTMVWLEFVTVACRTLRSLDLSSNHLSSNQHISTLVCHSDHGHLLSLILLGNPIHNAGMRQLCTAIKGNRTFALLSCAECELTLVSNTFLMAALLHNAFLRRVYMYGNKASECKSTASWRFWIQLNVHGRRLLEEQDDGPSKLIPGILARVSSLSILHGLLRERVRYLRS
jgi:hypothetical protein